MKKILAALAMCMVVMNLSACSGDTSGNTGGNYGETSAKSDTQTSSEPESKPESVPEETRVSNKAWTFDGYDGTYTGDWHNGAPNGNGTFTAAGQLTMSGEWADGNLNGQGTVKLENGSVVSGNFVNSALNGKGTRKITYINGTIATEDGTYNDGHMVSGKMTINYADGSTTVCQGDYDSEVRLASGTKTVKNVDGSSTTVNNGVWSNGTLSSGTMTKKFTDGSSIVFEGYWNEGVFYNGRYTVYSSDGSQSDSGTFTDGKQVSDFDAAVGGFIQGIGDYLTENDHPWLGLGAEILGEIIGS